MKKQSVGIRILAILGLFVVLFSLTVWFGSLGPAPQHGAYPDTSHFATEYQQYLGDRVSVGGRIVDTAPVTIVTKTPTGHHLRLTVTDLPTSVTEDRMLFVYGVLKRDHSIRAIRGFTVAPSGSVYAWTVSFLAGVWVLARFVRYWRVDTTNWTLVPRSDSTSEGRLGGRRNAEGERDDA